jgi:hypothetical protein
MKQEEKLLVSLGAIVQYMLFLWWVLLMGAALVAGAAAACRPARKHSRHLWMGVRGVIGREGKRRACRRGMRDCYQSVLGWSSRCCGWRSSSTSMVMGTI